MTGIAACHIQRTMGVDSSDVAVCVHLVGGVWGLLAPGFLAAPSGYGKSYAGMRISIFLFHSQLLVFLQLCYSIFFLICS